MAQIRDQHKIHKSSKQDGLIMETNSSSIKSKRSVERLYFPRESQIFRHFVKKPQRRSPLINRGYWLRMKAIDFVAHEFLAEVSTKRKIIINLGCGYDPLPWQCIARYPELCRGVMFVDIDYQELMMKKREIVNNTAELRDKLTDNSLGESPVLLTSNEYIQIACDLGDLSALSAILSSLFDLDDCLVLFSAEVSITYMTNLAADALIKWTSTFPDEQVLPEGPDHPFARAMLSHFNKLQTPLRSVHKYQKLAEQEARFLSAGWNNARAVSLWELWSSSTVRFSTPEERSALDEIEPFDEWEEFALFGCHYFLLVAENGSSSGSSLFLLGNSVVPQQYRRGAVTAGWNFRENGKQHGLRRFAAAIPLRSVRPKRDLVGNFGGIGINTRVCSWDVYSQTSDSVQYYQIALEGPSSRMCHTITDLGDRGAILTGGRSSPDHALADCWLFHKWTNSWERVDDLPCGRYRHSAVAVGNGSVLVIGGKTKSACLACDVLLWSRRNGWTTISETGLKFQSLPRFGAILCTSNETSGQQPEMIHGLLAGGMSRDGIIISSVWRWTLRLDSRKPSNIEFESLPSETSFGKNGNMNDLARFGGVAIGHMTGWTILGGIGRLSLLSRAEEVVSVNISGNEPWRELSICTLATNSLSIRPLLIGISVSQSGQDLIVTGGGAVCFSFGTHWNKGSYTLVLENRTVVAQFSDDLPASAHMWRYLETVKTTNTDVSVNIPSLNLPPKSIAEDYKLENISRIRLASKMEFTGVLSRGQPQILERLALGSCLINWNLEYLKARVGYARQVNKFFNALYTVLWKDRNSVLTNNSQVIVHDAMQEQMNFLEKNFSYETMEFGTFIDAIRKERKLYLRSVSSENASRLPADIEKDFPTISGDFSLPKELDYVLESMHSSVLRISGLVKMWLHYDVMANVLCQIKGSKRVILFAPSDVQYLGFSPGASSSTVDVFRLLEEGKLGQVTPYEALLKPGDTLYIPPFWLHSAAPLDETSVAVNIFFKSLHGYAPGRDVYGNRDLQAYEQARRDMSKISKLFDSYPADVGHFYKLRLAGELLQDTASRR